MAIVTFCNNGSKETGNTTSCIAIATYMAIKHNIKVLLISTGINENTMKESFWPPLKNKKILDKRRNTEIMQNGIEGLNRMVSSSKIEPRIIRDYTRVILKDRFDVLLGMDGTTTEYNELQDKYPPIVNVANQFYDMIFVDLDKRLRKDVKIQMMKISDILIFTSNQKVNDIQRLMYDLEQNKGIDKRNTLIVLGRYDENLKSNAKNLARTVLKQRTPLNTVPYNGGFLESMQEGRVIDVFLSWRNLKNKRDPNYIFIEELERTIDSINNKWEEVKILRGM